MKQGRKNRISALAVLIVLLAAACAAVSGCALLKPAWRFEVKTKRMAYEQTHAKDGTLLATVDVKLPQLVITHDALAHSAEPPAAMTTARDVFNAEMERFHDGIPALSKLRTAASDDRSAAEKGGFAFREGYRVRLRPESVYQTRYLLSVCVRGEEYTGGAHPMPCAAVWNFDLEGGRFLTLGDMTDRVDDLRALLAKEIAEQIGTSGDASHYFADYAARTETLEGAQLYFAEDGLHVLFSVYQIAPFSEGEPEFVVSYAALKPYWNAYGRELLTREN